MPTVHGKKFAYTAKGRAAAKKEMQMPTMKSKGMAKKMDEMMKPVKSKKAK